VNEKCVRDLHTARRRLCAYLSAIDRINIGPHVRQRDRQPFFWSFLSFQNNFLICENGPSPTTQPICCDPDCWLQHFRNYSSAPLVNYSPSALRSTSTLPLSRKLRTTKQRCGHCTRFGALRTHLRSPTRYAATPVSTQPDSGLIFGFGIRHSGTHTPCLIR
jgi:hypothetical protein